MAEIPISLDEAIDLTRTGDVWLFRGRKVADRAIQVTTNSPVNHVGMSVVIDDLPPLMWHAELGVPHQRRQVVDDDGHAHVVDRAVRRHLDGPVGDLPAAEQPYVAGTGQVDR